MQARRRVDLGRSDPLVPEELLHLVQWHASVKQNGRHACPQPMRSDVLIDAGSLRGVLDQPLNVSRGVFIRAVALEDVAVASAVEIGSLSIANSIMLNGRLSPAWPLISHIFISGDERQRSSCFLSIATMKPD